MSELVPSQPNHMISMGACDRVSPHDQLCNDVLVKHRISEHVNTSHDDGLLSIGECTANVTTTTANINQHISQVSVRAVRVPGLSGTKSDQSDEDFLKTLTGAVSSDQEFIRQLAYGAAHEPVDSSESDTVFVHELRAFHCPTMSGSSTVVGDKRPLGATSQATTTTAQNRNPARILDPVSLQALREQGRNLTEAFCHKHSLIGEIGKRFYHDVFRGTAEVDLRSTEGRELTKANIRRGPFPALWGSLVCTPWCHWMPLNLARGTDEMRARVSADREQSLEDLRFFGELCDLVATLEGVIAFEWPTGIEGWQLAILKAIIARHNLVKVNIHGCMLGLVAPCGTPMKKAWTIATNCSELRIALSAYRCDGSHTQEDRGCSN
jgi:hypothetical protein